MVKEKLFFLINVFTVLSTLNALALDAPANQSEEKTLDICGLCPRSSHAYQGRRSERLNRWYCDRCWRCWEKWTIKGKGDIDSMECSGARYNAFDYPDAI